jgi:hypothetical protein
MQVLASKGVSESYFIIAFDVVTKSDDFLGHITKIKQYINYPYDHFHLKHCDHDYVNTMIWLGYDMVQTIRTISPYLIMIDKAYQFPNHVLEHSFS